MADPMQISLSKLQWSLRKASETHFSKLSDSIIRHPISGGLSRRRCKCQNLVMLWKFNITNLSGHMTDMLWITLAVILWTPMPANWCQVNLPSWENSGFNENVMHTSLPLQNINVTLFSNASSCLCSGGWWNPSFSDQQCSKEHLLQQWH